MLSAPPVQRLLSDTNLAVPTIIIPFNRNFVTHLLLSHYDANTFNVTVVWTNWDVREAEGLREGRDHSHGRDRGDLVLRWLERFEVEWVTGTEETGLAFKGGFWGKEGLDSHSPEGVGKDSAEVWFTEVISVH